MADDAIASTPVSQPIEMEVLDVAAEGDVVFNLKLTRLRVSSAILASASPVFKVMLGPVFREGQDFRSAQYPKQIPLEDDSAAITRLCFLLHHERDPIDPASQDISLADGSEGLFALAVVADKYGCADAVRTTGSSLVSHFVYSSISIGMSIEAVMYLVSTAYVLGDPRHFALLTRHLVMDYSQRFSSLASYPAMAVLPHYFFLLAEEQREDANMMFRDDLLSLADGLCGQCTTDHGPEFLVGFFKQLGSRWPPNNRSSILRSVLKKTASCGDVSMNHKCPRHGYDIQTGVTSKQMKDLCVKASAVASGVCLTCAREENFVDGPCEHHQILKQCVDDDPIF